MTPDNKAEHKRKLLEALDKALVNHPDGKDAINFISAFGEMCHLCDDIIDDPEFRKEPEQILKLTKQCLQVYSSKFYQKYTMELYAIISMVHDVYANSVWLENSPELWKKEFSDPLRNIGNCVPVYIVTILVGYEAGRIFSRMVLQDSYDRHHNELGKAI